MEISKPVIFFIGGIGILMLLAGFIMEWYGNGKVISVMMSKQLALQNGSMGLFIWQKPPQEMTFSVYFFNVTNPEQVSNGSKPNLVEVGPYVYTQRQEKVDVRFEANDTISYRLKRTMFFNTELSGCRKDTDIVTTLNFPMVGTVMMIESSMPYALEYLNDVWPLLFPGIKNIFLTAPVKDFLFDGIDINCTSREMAASMVCNNLDGKGPETIRKAGRKLFKFSFFYHRNQTEPGVFRVYRGNDDLRKLSQIYSYNNHTEYKMWGDKYCGMMNGSDGSQFPVNLDKKDDVYIFQTDVCRSLFAEYEKETSRDGVKLYRYRNTEELFNDKKSTPSNECYCSSPLDLQDEEEEEEEITEKPAEKKEGEQKEEEEEEYEDPPKICKGKGAMLLTPCVKVPVIATFPHYYMGDPSYLEFTGLKPNKTLHETFSEIEPTTGMPVKGYKRLQFNLEIKPLSAITLMKKLPTGLMPAIWIEEGFTLSDKNFAMLKHSIDQKTLLSTVTYVLIGVGVLFLLIAYTLYAKRQKMCCWESSFSEPRRSSKIEGYDNAGFGAKGFYSDKIKNNMSMANGEKIQMKNHKNSEGFPNVETPMQQSYNRMNPAFRRQSNVVSYIENFM